MMKMNHEHIIVDKQVCPRCGSDDFEPAFHQYDASELMYECYNCGEEFSAVLDECSCGCNEFIQLRNGYFLCVNCHKIYSPNGLVVYPFCINCGCSGASMFRYEGYTDGFEEKFVCKDCGAEYDGENDETFWGL